MKIWGDKSTVDDFIWMRYCKHESKLVLRSAEIKPSFDDLYIWCIHIIELMIYIYIDIYILCDIWCYLGNIYRGIWKIIHFNRTYWLWIQLKWYIRNIWMPLIVNTKYWYDIMFMIVHFNRTYWLWIQLKWDYGNIWILLVTSAELTTN